jgi:putative oxidoreductase
LQRLFSTFPNGRPGAGLLVLRLAAGGSLIADRVASLAPLPATPLWEFDIALICAGSCLCLGIWTPVAGVFVAVAEIAMAVFQPVHSQSELLLAIVAISLTLLGPGAWSVDALMFGRKRITV